MKVFFLCFIPMFVAVDAVGVLPMFLGFTEGMDRQRIRRIIWESVITASLVALIFLVVGVALLRLLGITVADFMVAGGALLFVLSINDLLTHEKKPLAHDAASLGAVPLGVPLITGPAVLTTSMLLMDAHGIVPTAISIVANIGMAGVAFSFAPAIHRILGRAGAKTVSKIASLLLAAIGVMIIRKGVVEIIRLGMGT